MTPDSTRPLWIMGAFGFLSGLPLPLTAFTLQLWLTSFGISVHAIGLVASLGLPYTLKFLWSGFFDRTPPAALARLGRRRGWLLVIQPLLACACVGVALSDPGRALPVTLGAVLVLAFFSASQDVLIDAWRIETFPERLQGTALAAYVWGYRGAMITATSGALWVAGALGWRPALLALAAIMAAGMGITLLAPHVAGPAAPARPPGWRAGLQAAFIDPLGDFLTRRGAVAVLAFVVLFRLGKVFADLQAASFYTYAVGFSKTAIGSANLYGWAGTLAGAALGAGVVLRLGTLRALLLTGTLQALSLGLYLALLATGPSEAALTAKIMLENAAGAMADMAFLTYVSGLCSRAYTATQYALLSSLAALAFHTLGGTSGYAAEALGWRSFYVLAVLASLPALALLWPIRRSMAARPG